MRRQGTSMIESDPSGCRDARLISRRGLLGAGVSL